MENDQPNQNNNDLEFTSADVKKTPNTIKAAIVSINVVKAKDVYGDKVKDENQELIKLTLQNANFAINDEEYLPFYPKGSVPDNSKLGKFLLKYNTLERAMTIDLTKDKNGFYKIDLVIKE